MLDAPASGATSWIGSGRSSDVNLLFESKVGDDAVLTLERTGGSKPLHVYLRGGETAKVAVPPGTYVARFEQGNGWLGWGRALKNRTGLGEAPVHLSLYPSDPGQPKALWLEDAGLSVAGRDGREIRPVVLKKRRLPKSGIVVRQTNEPGVAPLQLKSSVGNHFYMKLKRGGRTIVTVFIRGGDDVEVRLPLGTYTIEFASGSEWYGRKHLFGPDTRATRAEGTFEFRRSARGVTSRTITLYKVSGGNLRTQAMDIRDF